MITLGGAVYLGLKKSSSSCASRMAWISVFSSAFSSAPLCTSCRLTRARSAAMISADVPTPKSEASRLISSSSRAGSSTSWVRATMSSIRSASVSRVRETASFMRLEYVLFLGFFQAAKKGLNHLPRISIRHDLSVLAGSLLNLCPSRFTRRGQAAPSARESRPAATCHAREWLPSAR